jgi:hypothetical protein
MEAVDSSEMSVPICQTTLRQIPDDDNRHYQNRQDMASIVRMTDKSKNIRLIHAVYGENVFLTYIFLRPMTLLTGFEPF